MPQRTASARPPSGAPAGTPTGEPSREPSGALAGPVPLLDGIEATLDGIEGAILDLWGTVHNGFEPLPGAIDAMERLKARGIKVLILSNAPRRAHSVIEKMDEIGIARDLYDAVLSSGEAANTALRERDDPWHKKLGPRAYLLGPDEDDSVLEEVPTERAESLGVADYIVAVGAFKRKDTVRDYEDFLSAASVRHLPMVCANPDLVVIRGTAKEICAGAIAARYADIGGDVYYHGKPHAPIYRRSLELLGIDAPDKLLAIGDSLHTDVAGAAAAGIKSVFVTSGIYADRLHVKPFDPPPQAALDRLCATEKAWPDYAVPAFRW
jgi:HAD superfamily hydrolase (TIGR01459 family)